MSTVPASLSAYNAHAEAVYYLVRYPPRYQTANGAVPQEGFLNNDPLPAALSLGFFPDIPSGPGRDDPLNEGNVVHFDLDPGNIFVPGFNAGAAAGFANVGDHSEVPRLLVGPTVPVSVSLVSAYMQLTQPRRLPTSGSQAQRLVCAETRWRK